MWVLKKKLILRLIFKVPTEVVEVNDSKWKMSLDECNVNTYYIILLKQNKTCDWLSHNVTGYINKDSSISYTPLLLHFPFNLESGK